MLKKKILLSLILLIGALAIADTPPQVINKQCSSNEFFSQIQPGPGNINCTQPTYSGILGTPSFIDSLTLSGGHVSLVGDSSIPGNSKYYGTNGSGSLGYYSFSNSAIWGNISGTLSNQTDLQSALNGKQSTLTFGTISSPTSGVTVTNGSNATVGPNTSVSIQTANTSQPGLLSASDWNTFNNKEGAIVPGGLSTSTTGVTVTNGSAITVGPSATINIATANTSTTGLLNNGDWNTFNNKQSALTFPDSVINTSGAVTLSGDAGSPGNTKYYGTNSSGTKGYYTIPNPASGNLTDVGTDGITVTGGTGAVLGSGTSIAQAAASASQNGYLTSTNFSTFNGKQSALTFADSLTNSGGTVTLSGDSATPGNSKYYGTNSGGSLGYYTLPSNGVSSLNSLTGALNIVAGTNISVTPSGSSITIASTGSSGANTALSNLASTAVNADILPGTTNTINLGNQTEVYKTVTAQAYTISLPNNTSTGTIVNRLVALDNSNKAVVASSSFQNIIGIAVAGAGTSGNVQVAISGTATCSFQGSPSPPDFVGLFGNSGLCVDIGSSTNNNQAYSVGRILSTSGSTGVVDLQISTPPITSYGSPLFNSGGELIISAPSGQVLYGSGNNTANFFYDQNDSLLGIGTNAPVASVQGNQFGNALSAPNGSSLSANLVMATAPGNVTTVSTQQVLPVLSQPYNFNGNQSDNGSSNCGPANGSEYVYQIWAEDNTNQWSAVSATSTMYDNNDANNFQWNLTWNQPTTNNATDYYICVSMNGGGLQCYDTMSTLTSSTDMCNAYTAYAPPSPLYNDFIANGTTYNFNAYGAFTSPGGGAYYSPSAYPFSFTDDNSGNPFQINIFNASVPGGANNNEIVDSNTGNAFFTDSGGNFTLAGYTPQVPPVTSPNGYGIQANGSNLNLSFSLSDYISALGTRVYQSTPSMAFTNDPSDSNYYYVSLSTSSSLSPEKLVNITAGNSILTTSGSTIYLDALSNWIGDALLTPNSFTYPAGALVSQNQTDDTTSSSFVASEILGNTHVGGIESIIGQDANGTFQGSLTFENSKVGLTSPLGGVENLFLDSNGNVNIYQNSSNSTHLITSQATAPTVAADTGNLGTGGTCTVTSNSTDIAGQITINAGSVPINPGIQCQLNFNKYYPSATNALCTLTPANSTAGHNLVGYYVFGQNTYFQIDFAVLAASSATYVYNYHCMGL